MGSKPPAGSVFLGVTTAQRGCFLVGLITLHFAPLTRLVSLPRKANSLVAASSSEKTTNSTAHKSILGAPPGTFSTPRVTSMKCHQKALLGTRT